MIFFFQLGYLQAAEESMDVTIEKSYEGPQVRIKNDGQLSIDGVAVSYKELNQFMEHCPDASAIIVTVLAGEEVSSSQVLRVMNICCNYKIGKVRLIYSPSWNHKS